MPFSETDSQRISDQLTSVIKNVFFMLGGGFGFHLNVLPEQLEGKSLMRRSALEKQRSRFLVP